VKYYYYDSEDMERKMNVDSVLKIRIAGILSRHGHLSAKVVANKVKVDLPKVADALAGMIKDGHVYADDTGRCWGGQTVYLFSMVDAPRSNRGKSWDNLVAAINDARRTA
jgi:predicted ArsR family transcriptional regulator